MGFIYKLTLKKESRKAYIGQTIRDIHKRLEEHQYASGRCRAISRAIQKYGWDNFDKEWYEVPDEELNFYEEMLVALLGTLAPGGYNLMEGGGSKGRPSEETKKKMSEAQSGEKNPMYGKTLSEETKKKLSEARTGEKNQNYGKTPSNETKRKLSEALSGEKHPMYGKNHTEETKKKISEAHIGKTLSDEHKQKISDANLGKTLSKESKQKISEALSGEKNPMYGKTGEKSHMYGKTLSEETKKKISDAQSGEKHPMYGKNHTEETKQKMSDAHLGEKNHASKRVYQYTINDIYVDAFASSGEAAQSLEKTDGSKIRMCARGDRQTAYGFKWSRELL